MLLLLVPHLLTQHDLCNNPVIIEDPYQYEGIFDLSKATNKSYIRCQVSTTPVAQRAFYFQVTAPERGVYELSTCYPQTSLSSRIVVASRCDVGDASTFFMECKSTNDGDPQESCRGTSARILYRAAFEETFLFAVAGSGFEDTGIFKITVNKIPDDPNISCDNPRFVSIPTVQYGVTDDAIPYTMSGDPIDTSQRAGLWYRFIGTGSKVFIDLCNTFTTTNSSIYVYNEETFHSNNCGGNHFFDRDTGVGCGLHQNPRIQFDTVEGRGYIVFVANLPNRGGQIQVSFKRTMFLNEECSNAFALNNFPLTGSMDMSNYATSQPTACQGRFGRQVNAMWLLLVGDGTRYILDTCESLPPSGSSGIYDTFIDVLDGCDSETCVAKADDECGSDAFLPLQTEVGKNYYIKVGCFGLPCVLTIKVSKEHQVTNETCASAYLVDIMYENAVYNATFNVMEHRESQTGCVEFNPVLRRGAWFNFVRGNKAYRVITGIVSNDPGRNRSLIEVHPNCRQIICIDDNKGNEVLVFDVPRADDRNEQDRIVFATTLNVNPIVYTSFQFWAMHLIPEVGLSFEKPINVRFETFTIVEYIGPENSYTSPCTPEFSLSAVIFKYTFRKDIQIYLTTCNIETSFLTGLEIVERDEDTFLTSCVSKSEDDPNCRNGTTMRFIAEEDRELYPIVHHEVNAPQRYGTFRLNIYQDRTHTHSACLNPSRITLPFEDFAYINRAHTTRENCLNPEAREDGLRGHWYRVVIEETGLLVATTTDHSQCDTQIHAYQRCDVVVDTSNPTVCLGYAVRANSAHGSRGVKLQLNVTKDDIVLLFVGGATNRDVGIINVLIEYGKDDSDQSSSNNPNKKKVEYLIDFWFWIIAGALFLGFVVVSLCVFAFFIWKDNEKPSVYGGLV